MPITFELNNNAGYFISTWAGVITNTEMLAAYKDFFEGEDWSPRLNELADISQAYLFNVTSDGLLELAKYAQHVYRANDLAFVKTSAYCPQDLPFCIARLYDAWTIEAPESVKVFRDIHEAESWLMPENKK